VITIKSVEMHIVISALPTTIGTIVSGVSRPANAVEARFVYAWIPLSEVKTLSSSLVPAKR
jgi:hypothetical protein